MSIAMEELEHKIRLANKIMETNQLLWKVLREAADFKPRGPHPLAGKVAVYKDTGQEVYVEDWFDRLVGTPYLTTELTKPPFIIYFCRMKDGLVPADNDVVIVKHRGSSCLVHNSELEEKYGNCTAN